MKLKIVKGITLIVFFLICDTAKSQIKATTKDGKKIILHLDSTWEFVNKTATDSISFLMDSLQLQDTIYENPKEFKRSKKATLLMKSKKVNVGVYINNNYWSVRRSYVNEVGEYNFFDKITDASGFLISNASSDIDIYDIRDNLLRNAQIATPDAVLVMSELRTVNGVKVLYTDIVGTDNKYKSELLTYSFVNEHGNIQLILGSSQDNVKRYRDVYEDFLNGFVLLK